MARVGRDSCISRGAVSAYGDRYALDGDVADTSECVLRLASVKATPTRSRDEDLGW